jgi:chromate reductase, NAD(P)H dehydrogenase (quinone)
MTINPPNPPASDIIDVDATPRGADRPKEQSVDETQGLTILGISGSLRSGSLNTALLRAAIELSPPGMDVVEYGGLRDVPPYDGDMDGANPPEAIADLRRRIREADGLLFATPEYNYSIPGVLKNAIDWASRPPEAASLQHKHVAIMGAAPANSGTMRAQLALRQMFAWIGSVPVVQPEIYVFRAAERFDENGQLSDQITGIYILQLLEALRSQILHDRVLRETAPA